MAENLLLQTLHVKSSAVKLLTNIRLDFFLSFKTFLELEESITFPFVIFVIVFSFSDDELAKEKEEIVQKEEEMAEEDVQITSNPKDSFVERARRKSRSEDDKVKAVTAIRNKLEKTVENQNQKIEHPSLLQGMTFKSLFTHWISNRCIIHTSSLELGTKMYQYVE